MKQPEYEVLLYYKYVDLPNPEKDRDEQRALCTELGLKGRIIVANEGINGTLEGTRENTQKYIEAMNAHPSFKDISFKQSVGTGSAFPKLSVKARSEVVTAGMPNLNPNTVTGTYL